MQAEGDTRGDQGDETDNVQDNVLEPDDPEVLDEELEELDAGEDNIAWQKQTQQ